MTMTDDDDRWSLIDDRWSTADKLKALGFGFKNIFRIHYTAIVPLLNRQQYF
jgi:hypothetical protein